MLAGHLAGLVDGDDVGMVEALAGLGLALEALDGGAGLDELGQDALDRHAARGAPVGAQLLGLEHLAHAASGDEPDEVELAEASREDGFDGRRRHGVAGERGRVVVLGAPRAVGLGTCLLRDAVGTRRHVGNGSGVLRSSVKAARPPTKRKAGGRGRRGRRMVSCPSPTPTSSNRATAPGRPGCFRGLPSPSGTTSAGNSSARCASSRTRAPSLRWRRW